MKYKTIQSSLIVLPENDPIFSEQATTIRIEDEAAGAFVCVSQCTDKNESEIRLTTEEWPEIRRAIDKMMLVCDKLNREKELI